MITAVTACQSPNHYTHHAHSAPGTWGEGWARASHLLSATITMLRALQAIFQCSYSLNRVQGWACRRPGTLSVVLQEVDHCLSDCPQLPVRSYTRKSGSWLWLQVPVLKQPSQAQSPRTVKAAALSIPPWVHCCSLTGYILVSNRCTQWETTQLRADDRLQDTRQRDKSHTHRGKRWPGIPANCTYTANTGKRLLMPEMAGVSRVKHFSPGQAHIKLTSHTLATYTLHQILSQSDCYHMKERKGPAGKRWEAGRCRAK